MSSPTGEDAVDREHVFEVLQRRYEALQSECEGLRAEREAAAKGREEEGGKLARALDGLEAAQEAKAEIEVELAQARRDVGAAEARRVTAEEASQRLHAQLAERTRAMQQVVEDAAKKAARCAELEAQLYERDGEAMKLKFRADRVEQEKELGATHAEWLTRELESKSKELGAARREASAALAAQSGELDTLRGERDTLAAQVEALTKKLTEREAAAVKQMERAREDAQAAGLREGNLVSELEAQQRLTALYKESAEEEEAKVERAHALIGELKEHTESLKAEHKVEVRRFEELMERSEEELQNASRRIARLEAQGGHEAREEAHARQSAQKSPTAGISASATEMYTELSHARDSLAAEQRERKKQEDYLRQVLNELESKAPLIHEQKLEYDRVLQSHALLSQRLEAESRERDRLASALALAVGEKKAAAHELAVVQRERESLRAQVRSLQKGLAADKSAFSPSSNPLLAPDVESTALVVAHDAQGEEGTLQDRCEMLQRRVFELEEGAKQAALEFQARCDEAVERGLAGLQEEVERLQSAREQQEGLVTGIVQQRNMYKQLYEAQIGGATPGKSGSKSPGGRLASPGVPGGGSDEVAEDDPARLAAELSRAKEDIERCRREGAANLKLAREQLDEARLEAAELRVQVASAQSGTAFAEERYKLLQENMESTRKDAHDLVRRNTQYGAQVEQLGQRVSELSAALDSAREDLRLEKVASNKAMSEKALLTQQYERLEENAASLSAEKGRLQASLSALQIAASGASGDGGPDGEKMRLQIENDQLVGQVARLREEISQERTLANEKMTRSDTVVHEATQRAIEKSEEAARLREQAAGALASAEAASAQRDLLQAQVQRLQERISQGTPSASAGVIQGEAAGADEGGPGGGALSAKEAFDIDMARLRTEVEDAKEEAALARSHVEQYRKISSAAEAALRDSAEAHEAFRADSEGAAQRLRAEVEQAQSRIEELQRELAGRDAAERERQAALSAKLERTEADAADLRRQVAEAEVKVREADARAEALKEDVKTHHDLWRESEANFQRELINHAKDAMSAEQARKEAEESGRALAALQQEKALGSSETDARMAEAESRLRVAVDEVQTLKLRLQDLVAQNGILHSQIEKLAKRHEARRSRKAAIAGSSAAESESLAPTESAVQSASATVAMAEGKSQEGGEDDATEELRELVRYLRREKEMVELQSDLKAKEIERVKQQVAHLSRELDEERELRKAGAAQVAEVEKLKEEHASRLVEKEQALSILRESNSTLRAESAHHASATAEFERKYVAAEGQLEPLQARIREQEAALQASRTHLVAAEKSRSEWEARVSEMVARDRDSAGSRVDATEHAHVVSELQGVRGELEAAQGELESVRQSLASTEEERDRLGEQAHKMQKAATVWKRKHDTAHEALDQARAELAEERGKLAEAVAERRDAAAVGEGQDQEAKRLREELLSTMGKLEEMEEARDELQEAVEALSAERDAQAVELGKAESRIKLATGMSSKLQDQCNALKERVEWLEGNAGKLEDGAEDGTIKGDPGALERLQAELQEERGRAEEAEEARLELQSALEAAEAKVASLEEEVSKKESARKAAVNLSKRLKDEAKELEKKLKDALQGGAPPISTPTRPQQARVTETTPAMDTRRKRRGSGQGRAEEEEHAELPTPASAGNERGKRRRGEGPTKAVSPPPLPPPAATVAAPKETAAEKAKKAKKAEMAELRRKLKVEEEKNERLKVAAAAAEAARQRAAPERAQRAEAEALAAAGDDGEEGYLGYGEGGEDELADDLDAGADDDFGPFGSARRSALNPSAPAFSLPNASAGPPDPFSNPSTPVLGAGTGLEHDHNAVPFTNPFADPPMPGAGEDDGDLDEDFE